MPKSSKLSDAVERSTVTKPCPFCGSTANFIVSNAEQRRYWVRCRGCAAEGPWSKIDSDDALDRWDTRPSDIALRAALEEALDGWESAESPSNAQAMIAIATLRKVLDDV
jgi:Lar family restriction alleviation protein